MALTTFKFFIFAAVLVVLYFVVPKKYQWWVLLAASLGFYLMAGWTNVFFILITALSAYGAALLIEKTSQNKELEKAKRKSRKKLLVAGTLVLNFGLLAAFKYLNFFIDQINAIIRLISGAQSTAQGVAAGPIAAVSLVIPLGISFYTFQTMGYLVDVYWEKTAAQKNFFRLLLFTCFFPQITQGPISDYRQLSTELFTEHSFDYQRFAYGAQRFMWGLLKKMACADIAAGYVRDVFQNYGHYSGITTLIGAFLYSIQIYADFSGYMDMVCGLSEIMGIQLAENFDRPYFSKSVAEYWRRWHITLGAWFKNYIYYPIAMSKNGRKMSKAVKKKAGKRIGDAVPATIALLVTWFATGLWHGANWAYIVWGLLNGLFIILQIWLEPFYGWCKKILHIKETHWLWNAFVILRTFVLVTFIKVLPEVGTLSQGLGLWKRIFTEHSIPGSISQLLPFVYGRIDFLVMALVTLLILISDILKGRKPAREYFNRIPMIPRILILAVAFIVAIEFGFKLGSGEFLYANF